MLRAVLRARAARAAGSVADLHHPQLLGIVDLGLKVNIAARAMVQHAYTCQRRVTQSHKSSAAYVFLRGEHAALAALLRAEFFVQGHELRAGMAESLGYVGDTALARMLAGVGRRTRLVRSERYPLAHKKTHPRNSDAFIHPIFDGRLSLRRLARAVRIVRHAHVLTLAHRQRQVPGMTRQASPRLHKAPDEDCSAGVQSDRLVVRHTVCLTHS